MNAFTADPEHTPEPIWPGTPDGHVEPAPVIDPALVLDEETELAETWPAPGAGEPVEHREVAGWSGTGECRVECACCGVECACGVVFDGFGTLADATAALTRHIQNENRAAPVVAELSPGHTALIAGLRELADWYEAHPYASLPPYPDFKHCVLADADAAGLAEVEAIAYALGVPVTTAASGGQTFAKRQFGSLSFEAFYVSRERSQAYADDQQLLAAMKAAKNSAGSLDSPGGGRRVDGGEVGASYTPTVRAAPAAFPSLTEGPPREKAVVSPTAARTTTSSAGLEPADGVTAGAAEPAPRADASPDARVAPPVMRRDPGLDAGDGQGARPDGVDFPLTPSGPGDQLRRHLHTRHYNPAALGLTDAEALDQHQHEHDGPGTIRNHGRDDLSYEHPRPPCRDEYERPGGREPGDRIVRCHLPAGHLGPHEEADTMVQWRRQHGHPCIEVPPGVRVLGDLDYGQKSRSS